MNSQKFLNTQINNVRIEDVIQTVNKTVQEKQQGYIVALNVDVILKIEKDPGLRRACDYSLLNLADGKPLLWISRIFKKPIIEKISGSDLVPLLCKNAVEEKQSIFLLGGKEKVLKQAVKNLKKDYQDLDIAGYYSPPLGFEDDEQELSKIDELIHNASPDLLFVFLGCPKQEKWVFDHYKNTGAAITMCAGGTVDFLAGNIKRAPRWMSDHGFEWFFRFLMEPKRLFKRYFIDDPAIIFLVYRYWKRGKKYAVGNFMHHD